MKAVVLNQPATIDNLELVDLPDPGAPGVGEIRVRIQASSLNYHDLGVVIGSLPTADRRIPMSDGAGVVEAVGEGVTEFSVGDIVVSCFFPHWRDGGPTIADFSTTPGDGVDGYACEYVVHPAHWFTLAPIGYTAAQAATLTTAGLTAWRALVVDGALKAGDSVLLLGTGGVSIFALQIARSMGAEVIVTSSSDEKLERAKALGATHVVNYRSEPRWDKKVLELTAGKGVDHVVEVGGPETLNHSITACRIGGPLLLRHMRAWCALRSTILTSHLQRTVCAARSRWALICASNAWKAERMSCGLREALVERPVVSGRKYKACRALHVDPLPNRP